MPGLLLVCASPIEGRIASVLPGERLVEVGVGPARSAMNLTRALMLGAPPRLVVTFGLCGTFPSRIGTPAAGGLAVRDLCVVGRDVLADEGVATEDAFLDLPALGLAGEKELIAPAEPSARVAAALGVPLVAGATVGTCSGNDARARAIATRSGALVETMEGAAIALVCARFGLPWVQVRAVSNYCGDRARAAWDAEGALAALRVALPRAIAAI